MANDINLVVGYETLKEANRAVEKLGTSAQKSASVFERAFNRIDQQQQRLAKREKASQDEWAKRQRYRVRLMENSARMAEKQARDEARAQQAAARAVEEHSKAYRELIRSVDPAEAAIDDFTRKVDILNAEFKDKSSAEYAKRLGQIQAQAARAGVRMDKFGKVLGVTNKNARRTEIQMQQAGYQLQDFIVQVQAGTNPMIAFSQQGSQLAGFFAGPWGAAIGLGIAALGGLGTAFLTQGEKAKTFQEQMDELNSELEDYESITSRLSDSKSLSEEFGSLAGQAKEILLALQEIKRIGIQGLIKDFGNIGKVTTTTTGLGAADQVRNFLGLDTRGPAQTTFFDPDQVQSAQSFLGAKDDAIMENISYAQEFLRLVQSLQQAETFEAMVGPAGKLSEFLARHVDSFNVQGEKLKEIEAMQNTLLQITATQASAEDTKNSKVIRAYQTAGKLMQEGVAKEEAARNQAYTNALLQIGQRQKKEIKAAEEVERNRQSLMQVTLQNATKANSDRIQAETDADRVRQAMESRFREIKAEEDKALADQTHAHMMALQNAFYADAKKQAGEVAAATYLANYNAALAYMAYGESRMAAPSEPVKPKKEPRGRTKRDPLADLQKQVELEQALIGKTEARQRIIQALGVDFMKYGDKTINDLEAQINKTIQLEEAEKKRQEVIEQAKRQQEELKDSIESSMSDAFMSIIDGTKSVEDAFRDMARQIIAELMRVLVVKQMVSAATSFFGFADGGVFQGGSQVQAYANGGVVGGPTYFPMAGGKTGLMGEAGPEAIMPLKRGKDGKLGVTVDGGQQQSVVINQSFNFAANGDDSVKRIIASEAPKIAKMTEAQILDNRRRGGQFRKAFA